MSNRKKYFNTLAYLSFAVLITASYLVLLCDGHIMEVIILEDGIIETIGAVAFFLTSLISLGIFIYLYRTKNQIITPATTKLFFFCFFLLFLFAAGEEVSWGQRYFNLKTPDYLIGVNIQNEINLHNLHTFDDEGFLEMNFLFNLFWFTLTVVLPVTCELIKPVGNFFRALIPIVPWRIGVLFLYSYFSAKIAKLVFSTMYTFQTISLKQAVQEIKETNYAILFILVVLSFVQELKKENAG